MMLCVGRSQHRSIKRSCRGGGGRKIIGSNHAGYLRTCCSSQNFALDSWEKRKRDDVLIFEAEVIRRMSVEWRAECPLIFRGHAEERPARESSVFLEWRSSRVERLFRDFF